MAAEQEAVGKKKNSGTFSRLTFRNLSLKTSSKGDKFVNISFFISFQNVVPSEVSNHRTVRKGKCLKRRLFCSWKVL